MFRASPWPMAAVSGCVLATVCYAEPAPSAATQPATGPAEAASVRAPRDWDAAYAATCLYAYSEVFAEGYLAHATVHQDGPAITVIWRARPAGEPSKPADSEPTTRPAPALRSPPPWPTATGAVVEMSLGRLLPERTVKPPDDVSEVTDRVTLEPTGKTLYWRSAVGRDVDKQLKARLVDPADWLAQTVLWDRHRRDTPTQHPDRPPVTRTFSDVAPEGLIPYVTGERAWKPDPKHDVISRGHDLPCAWFMWKTRLTDVPNVAEFRHRVALRRKLAEAVNSRLDEIAADPHRSLHDSHSLVKSLAVTGASDLVFKRIAALKGTDCCYAPALIDAAVACGDLWLAEALIDLLPHASEDGPDLIDKALRALLAGSGPVPERLPTTTPRELIDRWQQYWTWRPIRGELSRDEIIDKARNDRGEPMISARYIPVARLRVQKTPPPGYRGKVYTERIQMESVWVIRYAMGPGRQQPERIRVFDARTGDDVDETVVSAEPVRPKG